VGADDLSAHRTRTNRKDHDDVSGLHQDHGPLPLVLSPHRQVTEPHPATVAEIDQVMGDVIEDRD